MQQFTDTSSIEPENANDTDSDTGHRGNINKTTLLPFINRLLSATKGLDDELNQQLSKLRSAFDSNLPEAEQLKLLKNVERQLMLHPSLLMDTLKTGDRATNQAAESMLHLLKDDNDITEKVDALLAQPKSTSIIGLKVKVKSLFYLYHNAVKNLVQSQNASGALTDQIHAQICDDLQRLIDELDFSGGHGSNLKKIRQQILLGISKKQLIDVCLQIINNIIEGAKEERQASKTFLHTVAEELNNISYKFDSSLSDSCDINQKQLTMLSSLKDRIDILDLDVSTSEDLDETKTHVQQGLEVISTSIKQHENLLKEKLHLEEQIKNIQTQLEFLKKETLLHTQRLEAQQHKLYLDSLTQVYNRAALDERFKLEFKRWQRYQHNLAVVIIDIDHFKNINDTFGHSAGDKALKIVARALQKSVKDTDFVSRYGGEEFVLLLSELNEDTIELPLERIRNTIKNIPFRFKGEQISITISIGATQFRVSDRNVSAPFERADKALYNSKSSGRNKVTILL